MLRVELERVCVTLSWLLSRKKIHTILYLEHLIWDPNVTNPYQTFKRQTHRKPAKPKQSRLRDTSELGVMFRSEMLLFTF